MAIISIARGCYSHGAQIAKKVAEMLSYECVDREILLEAVQFFNISETKLLKSIKDAPNVLDKITHGREKYISYFQAALLEHVKNNNVVYHGHAGHLLLPAITHILKIRIIADMPDRIALLQKLKNLTGDEARKYILKEDRDRTSWTRFLYKKGIQDPSLYDIVINIGTFTIQDACELICKAAESESFQATPETEGALRDLAISSHIKAALMQICDPEVTSHNGKVHITVETGKIRKSDYSRPDMQSQLKESIQAELFKEINEIAYKIPGVKHVACDIGRPDLL
jgi:cytidylate kinase